MIIINTKFSTQPIKYNFKNMQEEREKVIKLINNIKHNKISVSIYNIDRQNENEISSCKIYYGEIDTSKIKQNCIIINQSVIDQPTDIAKINWANEIGVVFHFKDKPNLENNDLEKTIDYYFLKS